MLAIVLPAKNECDKIARVLKSVEALAPGLVIPVVNGSTDGTLNKTLTHAKKLNIPVMTFHIEKPLGLDVPRAFGAKAAFNNGADYVLFLDADMDGNITETLHELVDNTIREGLDMSLVDCYAKHKPANTLAELVVFFRRQLNSKLGKADILKEASPSHGPHMISRRFLETVPFRELAIPPVSLAMAVKTGLKINIGAKLPLSALGNQIRDDTHSKRVVKLIIGDCIEAMNVFDGNPRTRYYASREFIGYHCERNFQLLSHFLACESH